jgi:GMP synthase (glutamine-hydrolysing)
MSRKNYVLILDFGSQYTKLIARRVRELGVFSEIVPFAKGFERARVDRPVGIIFSGGPSSVYAENAPTVRPEILGLGIPILGICYGLQLLAYLAGIRVMPAQEREYGLAMLEKSDDGRLLRGVNDRSRVWMSHGDKILDLPTDFSVTARTANCEYTVIEAAARGLYGVQFHPEVVHTEGGIELLRNFVLDICQAQADWSMKDFIEQEVARLSKLVGQGRIILGLSGGVDSTVLALLLHRAVGDRLFPVFVDTGLLRKNEFSDLMALFKKKLGLGVKGVDASDLFLARLAGVRSPERKRKIIGKTFIDVFMQAEKEHGPFQFFAQGTLYPDVIESVSVNGPSVTIKSHHNVGGLPKKLNWTLLEPFRELFKDEVRLIGRELGLDEEFISRHPFPGPGLAVRILGDVTLEKIAILQEADHILVSELKEQGLYDKTWQAFVVLLPVKSVGVMGDVRTYQNAVVIRMVESVDGMTADWYWAPHAFLQSVANRMVNEVKGINRVTYDITSKPPGTIEWE